MARATKKKRWIGNKNKEPTPKVYLTDVAEFPDRLRDQKKLVLEAGAALQGLASLRMIEALRLTWHKVDFERGLVEVSGVVKTESSARVIPICGRVVEALCRARRETVRSVDGRIVPFEQSYYSRKMQEQFCAWNPALGWQHKDLRKAVL